MEEIKAVVVAGLGSQKSKMVMMMMKLVKFESHQAVGSAEHYSKKTLVALGLLSCY